MGSGRKVGRCGWQDNGLPKMSMQESLEPLNMLSHGKSCPVDGIKFRILRWGSYPGLFEWAHRTHRGLCKDEAVGSESEGCDALPFARWRKGPRAKGYR